MKRKGATIFVSTCILITVLLPGSSLPDLPGAGLDKLVHLTLFAVWAIALQYDFHLSLPRLLLAGVGFTVLTEVLQLFVEGRTFDGYDMVADIVGLLVGFVAFPTVLRWVKRGVNE